MSQVSREETNVSNLHEGGRFLCFTLGKEKFMIPLLQVKEVIGKTDITPVPQMPSYFKGIMNLRGRVISVIDLGAKLKTGSSGASAESTIIILDLEDLSLGVIVDSVDSVAFYDAKDMSPPPDMEASGRAAYIVGVAKAEKSLTLVLDLKAVLDAEDFKNLKNQSQKSA